MVVDMSTAIEVQTETAQKLHSLAKTEGLSVDEILRIYVPGISGSAPQSPAEQAKAFRDWAESHRKDIPLLSDEAVSRGSFYE